MPLLLWGVVKWIFDIIIIKFLVMGVLFIIVYELTPFVLEQLGGFVNPTGLTSVFTSIPPTVWFFMDFMALDVGLPLMLVAHVSRFLIRRIPVIG